MGGVFKALVVRFGCIVSCVPVLMLLAACAGDPLVNSRESEEQDALRLAEEHFGIRVEGLQLSAAGSMLDFRYRVLDPLKAAPILNPKLQPYLLDEARGAKLGVPVSPVLGRIRQTSRNNVIYMDRTYFVIFGNPGKTIQSGDKVTLVLGDLKITDLFVR